MWRKERGTTLGSRARECSSTRIRSRWREKACWVRVWLKGGALVRLIDG